MQQADKLTVVTDSAVVSFQDIPRDESAPWDRIPDVSQFLAWPVDNTRFSLSAVLITLESGKDHKRLHAFDDSAPNAVTPHSALCIGSDIIFVQGIYAACLDVANWRIAWRVEAAWISCFGVFADPDDANAVIIHGETEITKLSLNGDVLWKVDGADIFTEPKRSSGLVFQNHTVIARDWNGWTYTIDMATGQVSVQKPEEDESPDQR